MLQAFDIITTLLKIRNLGILYQLIIPYFVCQVRLYDLPGGGIRREDKTLFAGPCNNIKAYFWYFVQLNSHRFIAIILAVQGKQQ